jgi:hypothetical protein
MVSCLLTVKIAFFSSTICIPGSNSPDTHQGVGVSSIVQKPNQAGSWGKKKLLQYLVNMPGPVVSDGIQL